MIGSLLKSDDGRVSVESCGVDGDRTGGTGVNHNLAILCTSVALGLVVSGQALAQDQYEFRFAFGSYCG